MREHTYDTTHVQTCSASNLSSNVDEASVATPKQPPSLPAAPPAYSALPESQRASLLAVASLAAAISPASTTTYYPAVNALAEELHVSVTRINWTISTYQIFQGLAPSFAAAFSDRFGRRPIYALCLSVNVLSNLGLAMQTNYASLMALRCLQSASASGTIALSQAVLDDLTTSVQRGKYIAYMSIGFIMGPAFGPAVGGLLSHFLGWRAIFWFLMIFGLTLLTVTMTFMRETNRSIVGDGSLPPQKWNQTLLQILEQENSTTPNAQSLEKRRQGVNPLASLRLLGGKENLFICIYAALMSAGYAAVISIFASQLHERYSFNEWQVGLCYLPFGAGSFLARWTSGRLIDRNFQRAARKQGLLIVKNCRQDLSAFDIEKVRLVVSFPLILATCGFVVAYGWLMEYKTHVAFVLVVSFSIGNVYTGAMVANTALLTDINPGNGAALGAAMNLTRCLMSAGGVAVITPLTTRIGIAYASTVTAGIWIAALPALWIVYCYGYIWRRKTFSGMEKDACSTQDGVSTV